jgi:sortase A
MKESDGDEVAYKSGKRVRRPMRLVITLLSVACIVAAVAVAADIGWFFLNSSVRGAALVRQERRSIALAAHSPRVCQTLPGVTSASGPQGLLEVPVLGLVAPVLQGTSDAVLNEAVGHLNGSAWPGQPGTTVLSAHDVTWFSSIGSLRPGDVVRYVTPCRTYNYQVTAHDIVPAGSAVYSTTASRIVLDTCYPFNALYLTSTRYLVYASLTSASPTHPLSVSPPAPPVPRVPAPERLAAQGLGLDENDAPMGTLTITGSPTSAWRQSSAPIQVQFAALAAYFGAIRSAEQRQRSWWADLAPSVPASAAAPIWGGQVAGYGAAVDMMLRVTGVQTVDATIATVVNVAAGASYDLTVRETVNDGTLLVTAFTMRPVP